MFGDGYIPPERDRRVEDDDTGLSQVVLLVLRSWPYIRPQILGRWYIPGKGSEDRVADLVSGEGYQFTYAPFLVAFLAISGPLFGILPATFEFPMNLLYIPVIAMAICMAYMAFGMGRLQRLAPVGLILGGIGCNIAATFVIDGFADGYYAALVTLACLAGWMVQFRSVPTAQGARRLEYRLRVGTHLVYFYAINFAQRFIALALGLVLADLLGQNILQNEPIAPGLARLIGVPEWAQGSITELTNEQRHDLLWVYVALSLGSYLLQLPLRIINPYYNLWIMQRINQDLRLALLARWHQLSLSYHSDHRTGDSIFRIYQDSAQVTAVIDQLIGITLASMSYLTCVTLVTLLDPWIGLIMGTIVIPAILWARWAMPRMRTRSLVYRAAASDITSTIQESFGAIRLIKAFGTRERTQRRMEEDSVIAFNAAFRQRVVIALVTIVMFTIASTFLMSAEFLIAYWANHGSETFATELIGLVGISFVVWNLASYEWSRDQLREASSDVRLILWRWLTSQDMAMGLHRVFGILDIEPDVKDDADAVPLTRFQREIRYQSVRFAYEANRPVLDDVSFRAAPGSITAIIGPTGSGKSTLMALLLRLYEPHSGTISIDGKELRQYQVDSLRRNIAIALQENVLFAMSLRDNIRYVTPDATDAQVLNAVRVADMEDYVAGLPQGLDSVLSDRGGKISTGQKQRLSIARAVVRDTPILILDEPTAALDAATEHRVMRNLTEWGKDKAIFLITHRISTIRRAHNIVYLDGGRIVESGDHKALMQREDGYYRSFVDAEANLTNVAGGS
jgi:ABC-type multidrug transport system fused ATPase/permease subunit|tara:strand:- start:8338 stop:10722 length:2385 start_codon:yes stop_codon:yes gene_type:complete